jgi:23S rRNA (guanosine2251-2'-O)-methyltransferase
MVGDPGIEPGMSHLGGVTVHCRTLQRVAQHERGITESARGRQEVPTEIPHAAHLRPSVALRIVCACGKKGDKSMSGDKKPSWVVDKERARRAEARETVWLFGLHAVRDALMNPAREKIRLVVTKNALDKLEEAVAAAGIQPEIADPRRFDVPIDEGSVHQGAALEVKPLNWGKLADVAISGEGAPLVVLLDRVTDPHNVGAVLRSAEVFGARAVIAPRHHSAPETGALAKTASGALERQPYLKVTNLAEAMQELKAMGYRMIGLDGDGTVELGAALASVGTHPVALVLGAEGPGLREKTRETCDVIARIPFAGAFGSLNVSNAAAVGLYAAATRHDKA